MSHAIVELDLSPLDEYDIKVAEEELRETPENVEKSLVELRKLLKGIIKLVHIFVTNILVLKYWKLN